MAWQKKSAAPTSFSLGQAFSALITGDTAWEWLLDFTPLLPPLVINTSNFCTLGPEVAPDLDVTVFAPVAGRTPLETAINLLQRAYVIQAFAYNRVFAAYCETAPAPGACVDDGPYHGAGSGGSTYNLNNTGTVPGTPYTVEFTVANYNGVGGHMGIQIGGRYGALLGVNHANVVDINVTANGRYSGPWLWPSDSPGYYLNSNTAGGDVTLHWCGAPTGGAPFSPTVPIAPTGYMSPAPGTYSDIGDLGAELDRIEYKLEYLTSIVNFVAGTSSLPPAPDVDAPITVVPDTEIETGDAVGCVITLGSIPAWADEDFGTPRRLHNIGRVSLGTARGWLPSYNIEASPMVLMPFPPGITRIQVNTHPAISASVTLLKPYK